MQKEINKKDCRGVWVLGEVRDKEIHAVSCELLAWGRDLADKLGVELACVILGHEIYDKTEELAYRGADKVYLVDRPGLEHFNPDIFSAVLTHLVQKHKPEIFIASATTTGRTIMPILAAKLKAGLTADCTGLEIDTEERLLIQTRPAVGGNVMATIKTPEFRPQMATVRPKSKRPLPEDRSKKAEIITEEVADDLLTTRISRRDFIKEESGGAPVQDAEFVVAVGKGLKDAKHLDMIQELSDCFEDCTLGASRPAAEHGWIPHSHQVGLSGKTVSPRVYIACGISGAVQHLAGMSSAETIIAVNSDPEAGIFGVADFGIVGDMFEVVPLLVEKIKEKKKEGR